MPERVSAALFKEAGFDFGVKPRVMLLPGQGFSQLWRKARCVGFAFGVLPQFRTIPHAAFFGPVFEDNTAGEEWMRMVASWSEPPYDGNGLNIHIVIDSEKSNYHVFLAPDARAAIERMLGPS